MMVSSMGRANQYTQLVKVIYCKLQTIGRQLSTFPHRVWGLNCRPQVGGGGGGVVPLHHHGPLNLSVDT